MFSCPVCLYSLVDGIELTVSIGSEPEYKSTCSCGRFSFLLGGYSFLCDAPTDMFGTVSGYMLMGPDGTFEYKPEFTEYSSREDVVAHIVRLAIVDSILYS